MMADFQKVYLSDTVFPCKLVTKDGHPNGESMGMTVRDYFAGQALTGMLATSEGAKMLKLDASEHAYNYADAMLEARKK